MTYLKMYFIIIVTCLFSITCSKKMVVYSDFDRDKDIRAFTTYNWLPNAAIGQLDKVFYLNELNDMRIKSSADPIFKQKGYVLTQDNPSLFVRYDIIVVDKTAVRPDPYQYHYGPNWRKERMDLYEFTEGTLVIDILDKEHRLLWRGWATSVLKDQQITNDLIQDAILEMFKQLPPSFEWKGTVTKKS